MSTGRGQNARPRPSDSSDGVAWLPIIGGLALGASILALLIKFLFGRTDKNCPKINPKKRRWPLEKKKSRFSFR